MTRVYATGDEVVVASANPSDFPTGQGLSLEATLTIANSGRVSCEGHDQAANKPVRLQGSGGASPSGAIINTTYYIKSLGALYCFWLRLRLRLRHANCDWKGAAGLTAWRHGETGPRKTTGLATGLALVFSVQQEGHGSEICHTSARRFCWPCQTGFSRRREVRR